MKAIKLFNFVHDNGLEYHWHHDLKSDYRDDVILFVDTAVIGDFRELLYCTRMSDDGFPCIMKNSYFCFWMGEICEYFDLDMDEVFPNGIIGGSE